MTLQFELEGCKTTEGSDKIVLSAHGEYIMTTFVRDIKGMFYNESVFFLACSED
jgi:hypothetical protein